MPDQPDHADERSRTAMVDPSRAKLYDPAAAERDELRGRPGTPAAVASRPEPAAEPDPPLELRVRVCTTYPSAVGTHVVDEDSPSASLCGREVAHVLVNLRKVGRSCAGCRRELTSRFDAGEWTGPTP